MKICLIIEQLYKIANQKKGTQDHESNDLMSPPNLQFSLSSHLASVFSSLSFVALFAEASTVEAAKSRFDLSSRLRRAS